MCPNFEVKFFKFRATSICQSFNTIPDYKYFNLENVQPSLRLSRRRGEGSYLTFPKIKEALLRSALLSSTVQCAQKMEQVEFYSLDLT